MHCFFEYTDPLVGRPGALITSEGFIYFVATFSLLCVAFFVCSVSYFFISVSIVLLTTLVQEFPICGLTV